MSHIDDEFLKALRQTFKVEASEHLHAIATDLLAIEKSTEPALQRSLIESVFRAAHSLKGASSAVEFTEVETVCQSLEDIFASWNRKEIVPSPSGFDVVHRALNSINDLLVPLIGVPEIATPSLTKLPVSQPSGPDAPRPTEPFHPQAIEQELWVGNAAGFGASPTTSESILFNPPAPVVEETVRIGVAKLDARLVEAEEMLIVKLTMRQRASDIREISDRFGAWKLAWASVESDVRELRMALDRSLTANANGHEHSLATNVGIHNAGLERITTFLHWNRDHFKQFEDGIAALMLNSEQDRNVTGKLVDDMLHESKKLLLLPFSTLVAPLPKLVRDLCREQAKNVNLEIKGDEVQIDKKILEEMKDPLIALLRNCIDHGIESAGIRANLKKPDRGTIWIVASSMNSGKIEIIVSDDGAGIRTQEVKTAAVKRALITQDDADRLTDQEAQQLIFLDEVSTSPIVTRLSGRGLGMAIVRDRVEKLGGTVEVFSQRGKGSQFRILLPSMLTTFRGILVETAGQSYVVPTSHVDRVTSIKSSDIQLVEGKEAFNLAGRMVALVRLADVLGLRATSSDEANEPLSGIPVVVLGMGDQCIAFRVDAVLDEQEVLVKPLRKPLVRVHNIAGATVLGSGRVVPILNVVDLLKSARKFGGRWHEPSSSDAKASVRKSVLIAEDSITSRMLIKNILESAGYRVKTAGNGMEAFAMLRAERFDVLVSDVEMPRMDGFGLTLKVRRDANLADMPIVLVTARETAEDKERGIDAGASAYIVKSQLDSAILLQTLRRLV